MPQTRFLFRKLLQVVVISFLCQTLGYSSHIIGGDITYTFLEFNDDRSTVAYEVEMVLYRDPTGVRLDDNADFGVYIQLDDGSWQTYAVVPYVPRGAIEDHDPQSDDCKTRYLNNERLEYTNYTFEVTLEISDRNYKIAYQKCCRNFTINNLVADGDLSAVYDVVITPEAMRSGNSSPKFGPIPPLFVCSGYDLNIDQSATDIDGDRLVYKFCTPLHSGVQEVDPDNANCCGCTNPDPQICKPDYPELIYEEGFSAKVPIGGSPQVVIDSETGFITGRPDLLGSYVVVVCVEEYRDGRLLGTVRRDFELNTIVCAEYLNADVDAQSYYEEESTGRRVAYYESCDDTRFSINNLSRDETYIKDYIWEIYDGNDNLVYNRSGLSSRDITLDLPGEGAYYGYMILNDNISCSDTAFMEFLVVPDISIDFTQTYNDCEEGPVQFTNLGSDENEAVSWSWDFGDGNFSNQRNPSNTFSTEGSYLIKLSAEDNYGCETSFEKEITYNLIEEKSSSFTTSICEGESYEYLDDSYNESGSYEFVFLSTDGCDSVVTMSLNVFENSVYEYADTICKGDEYYFQSQLVVDAGEYQETLTKANGCDSTVILHLHVGENLTRLELDNPIIKEHGSEIILVPTVEGGELIYKQWSSEELVLGNVLELLYIVEKDEKLFFESINELYCFAMDSVSIRSTINKGVYVPNIFSPNNDGDNDYFTVGFTKSLKFIGMEIFDRWGNLVYSRKDDTKALSGQWDGTKLGAPVEQGVYAYQLEFEFVNGDRAKQSGTVHLVR